MEGNAVVIPELHLPFSKSYAELSFSVSANMQIEHRNRVSYKYNIIYILS